MSNIGFINRKLTITLAITAIVCFSFSFIQNNHLNSIERATRKLEKKINHRMELLEEYSIKALETPVNQWLRFDKFPEDMVIYKYNADTLQSWVNLFPIGHDEVDLPVTGHIIHDLISGNISNTPLSFLGPFEQYVNLGSKWYVVKVYRKGWTKVVGGLEIKNEFPNENKVLKNSVNKKLRLSKQYATVPISVDDLNIVQGRNGEPLFSVTNKNPLTSNPYDSGFRWLSLLFAIATLLTWLYRDRRVSTFVITVTGITVLRVITIYLSKGLSSSYEILSPNLYADARIFNSLGILLINHIYIFLLALSFFMMRKTFLKNFHTASHLNKTVRFSITILLAIILLVYIHLTLRSLIYNSNVILELYRLEEISIYSILTYIAYALLFIALLFILQILTSITSSKKHRSLFRTKAQLIYILIISIYTVATISSFGFKKEYERNKVWTNKLAIERDLSMELMLLDIERKIAIDPTIRYFIATPQAGDVIRNKLSFTHMLRASERYDISIKICGQNDLTITDNINQLMNCHTYYEQEMIGRSTRLSPTSNFYFINSHTGRIKYIGIFTYFGINDIYRLYIEIESKHMNEAIGYPSLLLDNSSGDKIDMPSNYSWAKYVDGKLVTNRGRYNYPRYEPDGIKDGEFNYVSNGYIHFSNHLSSGNTIIISRPSRSVMAYFLFFSYIALFYSASIFLITGRGRIARKDKMSMPKNSFRRKISYLLTTSLVIALICMGLGSVIFSLRIYNENNRMQMEEKLYSVKSTLSEITKYAPSHLDINTPEMYNAMDRVANNTQVDINFFDPHGRLKRSTRPEVFDRYLISSRINPEAYNQIINENKLEYITQEKIADLTYHSLYSAIYNRNGTLIGIANIPYFSNISGISQDASSVIATIINIYLILLIVAFLGGRAVSNSLTKPLVEISRKMLDVGVSRKMEPINYRNKDELGVLVASYNKMLADLEESTKLLAQTEREQAWREMARQIAHEIKNPLTPMRLSIQHLIRLKENNVAGWEDKFDTVATSLIEQIDILSETATEFSSFAKFYNEDNTLFDLNAIINEQCALFDTRDNVKFEFISDSAPANVMARKSQITRVFVNLISNAIQAIENSEKGRVRITLRGDGKYYRIDIEDNGSGVSKDNQKKLFTPNFTTKSGGTGLGLAICRSIIEQSNGNISYREASIGGADFIIQLPIANEKQIQ